LMEIAVAGRVVSGELSTAVIRCTGSGVAEAAHQRLRVRAAAPTFLQHHHA
jgi:hypothetical protein